MTVSCSDNSVLEELSTVAHGLAPTTALGTSEFVVRLKNNARMLASIGWGRTIALSIGSTDERGESVRCCVSGLALHA